VGLVLAAVALATLLLTVGTSLMAPDLFGADAGRDRLGSSPTGPLDATSNPPTLTPTPSGSPATATEGPVVQGILVSATAPKGLIDCPAPVSVAGVIEFGGFAGTLRYVWIRDGNQSTPIDVAVDGTGGRQRSVSDTWTVPAGGSHKVELRAWGANIPGPSLVKSATFTLNCRIGITARAYASGSLHYSGPCPPPDGKPIRIIGEITVTGGPATVRYKWRHSPGYGDGEERALVFTGPGTKKTIEFWGAWITPPGALEEDYAILQVTSPTSVQSVQIDWSTICTSA